MMSWQQCREASTRATSPRVRIGDRRQKPIVRVMLAIASTPSTTMSARTGSKIAGMSQSQFYVKFREHAGMTFGDFKRRIRAGHARLLLARTSLVVTDVAYRVGFGDVRTLQRAFSGLYSTTPAEFRRREGRGQ